MPYIEEILLKSCERSRSFCSRSIEGGLLRSVWYSRFQSLSFGSTTGGGCEGVEAGVVFFEEKAEGLSAAFALERLGFDEEDDEEDDEEKGEFGPVWREGEGDSGGSSPRGGSRETEAERGGSLDDDKFASLSSET